MKVILMRDVPKVGSRLDVVEVANGYARNYLIPRGLAIRATPSALRQREHELTMLQRKAEREMIKMENLKQQLETAMLEIHIRAGEGGRLYGAVTSREIADQIKAQLGLEIDRRQIELSEPIHTAGIHSVPISLHHGITANLRVRIIPQTAEGGH